MRRDRLPVLLLGGGVAALVLLAVLGLLGMRVMPSYLAGWLFVLSVPVGALLLVTGLEAFWPEGGPKGGPEAAPQALQLQSLLATLRALLPLLPVAALLGLPVLLLAPSLYHPDAWPAAGIGRIWAGRGLFSLRLVLFLLVWSGLALLFAVPPGMRARRGAAGLAFGLTLVIGTLAAIDWVMAVQPGLASSSFGLLVLAGEAVSALALAGLLMAPAARSGIVAVMLMVLLAVWLFLHFTQFLVIWSADKPAEASWYLARIGGLGAVGLWFTAAVFVLALLLLCRRDAGRFVGPVAGLVLLVRLVESFWLVTPAFRGDFTLTIADLVAIVGLVAVPVGLRLGGWLPTAERLRHERA